jgi:hypothetical protein
VSRAYTVRLALTSGVDGVSKTIFTASPSFAWVVRDVSVWLPTAPTEFYLQLWTPGVDFVPILYLKTTAVGSYHSEMRQRMESGDYLVAVSVGGHWAIAVTGYQLDL